MACSRVTTPWRLSIRAILRLPAPSTWPPGATTVEIRLPAELQRGPVAGHVLGLDGTPIAGVEVRPYILPEERQDEYAFWAGLRYGAMAKTDTEGAFHFESILTERLGLQVWGGDVGSMNHWPVPEGADLDNLEVRLPRRYHFRVELRSQPERGDRFEMLDAAGERLPMIEGLGNRALLHYDVRMTDGRSSVLSVEETARTLVLYSGEEEVLRMSVEVSPDAIDVIEL
jgi:hypothetical protein